MKLYEIVNTNLLAYNIFIGKVGHYCDCTFCKHYPLPSYFSIEEDNSLIAKYLTLELVELDKNYLNLLEKL